MPLFESDNTYTEGVQGFCAYMNSFKIMLETEKAVIENCKLGKVDSNA
ncbi:hypothetical protein IMSAGC005_00628 [Lachnospiraceae bacterium]|nr:hypothetical protein IMSAGC005_00628 [Lachnospiraceae bacterium]